MHAVYSFFAFALTGAAVAQQIYEGFNSGASKLDETPKLEADFESEFTTAQNLAGSPGSFNSARLYTMIQAGTSNDPISAIPAAIKTNTSLLLGLWCSAGESFVSDELTALDTAISQYGDAFTSLVVGISVGSEDLYRNSESGVKNEAGVGASVEQITTYIQQVRDAVANTALSGVPIGHTDSWGAWTNSSNTDVVRATDFLGADIYSYFEDNVDNSIDNALNIFQNLSQLTTDAAGSKPVWITETGYPHDGPSFGKAEPSLANAQRYWNEVGCGLLFGRVNTWWFTITDTNPQDKAEFAVVPKELSTMAVFNVTCPAGSAAPAAVNGVFSGEDAAATGAAGRVRGERGWLRVGLGLVAAAVAVLVV